MEAHELAGGVVVVPDELSVASVAEPADRAEVWSAGPTRGVRVERVLELVELLAVLEEEHFRVLDAEKHQRALVVHEKVEHLLLDERLAQARLGPRDPEELQTRQQETHRAPTLSHLDLSNVVSI